MSKDHIVRYQGYVLVLGFLLYATILFPALNFQWFNTFGVFLVGAVVLPWAIYTKQIHHMLSCLFLIISPFLTFYIGLLSMLFGP